MEVTFKSTKFILIISFISLLLLSSCKNGTNQQNLEYSDSVQKGSLISESNLNKSEKELYKNIVYFFKSVRLVSFI